MIEDMAKNLVPAAALGMTTIWVKGGPHADAADEAAAHIHHVVEDLAEFLRGVRRPAHRERNKLVSPGTGAKRPSCQSAFACSMRSFELETKFHQICRGPSSAAPPSSRSRAAPSAASTGAVARPQDEQPLRREALAGDRDARPR